MTAAIKSLTSGVKKKPACSAPTVAAGFAKALVDLAVSMGADERLLLERASVDRADFADQDNRIPLAGHVALLKAAAELCDDPAFSLHFGEAFSIPELSIVGLIGESAGTVADAYEKAQHYAPLMVDTGEGRTTGLFEIVRNEHGTWAGLKGRIYLDFPQLTESAFARSSSYFTRNFPGQSFVKAVHFTHAEPRYRSEYERIFKVPLAFRSDKNAFLIDEDFLSLKFSPPNSYVLGILSAHADTLLQDLESKTTLKGRVEELLIRTLHTGEPGMDAVAKELGLSRSSLYRNLKAEGLSYDGLLDDVRRKLALRYLDGENASVSETAYRLGFSDPTAFSRAFKRWTGKTPGTARARNNRA